MFQIMLKKLEEQNAEIIDLKKGHGDTTTVKNSYNNTQNINHNIKMVAFGKEDIDNISDEVCKRLIKRGGMSVPKFIEYVHFDKNKPENHNVYISNIQNKYGMIYKDDIWQISKADDIMEILYYGKEEVLEQKYEKLKNQIPDTYQRSFERFIKTHTTDKVEKAVLSEIKLLLYNKRSIPLNTRKLIKQIKNKSIFSCST